MSSATQATKSLLHQPENTMSEHQALIDILADTLQEQRGVRLAITSLAQAIAGTGSNNKAKAPADTQPSQPAIAEDDAPSVDVLFPTTANPAPSGMPAADMFKGEATYAMVAERITALAKTDRPRVKATLDKFGAKNGSALKPEQYADFLEMLS